MAFTYDETETQQQKSDIFGGAQAPQQAPMDQNMGGQSGPTKSVEAGSSPIPKTGVGQTKGVTSSQSTGSSGDSTRIARVADTASRQKAPEQFGQISQAISGQKQDLQSQADNYYQSQAARVPSYSGNVRDDLGTAQGTENIRSFLQSDALQAEEFQFQDPGKFQDQDLIESGDFVTEQYRRGAGGQYSAGEAAFDRMMALQNKEIAQQVSDIQSGYSQLENQRESLPAEARLNAQSNLDALSQLERQNVQQGLGGFKDELRAANQAEADEYNARIGRGRFDPTTRAAIQASMDAARSNYIEGLDPVADADLIEEARKAELADNPFVTMNTQGLGYEQFLNQNEADRFNRIADLLGTGADPYTVTDPDNGRSAFDFDTAGYQQALADYVARKAGSRRGQEYQEGLSEFNPNAPVVDPNAQVVGGSDPNAMSSGVDGEFVGDTAVKALSDELRDQYRPLDLDPMGIAESGLEASREGLRGYRPIDLNPIGIAENAGENAWDSIVNYRPINFDPVPTYTPPSVTPESGFKEIGRAIESFGGGWG